MAVRTFWQIALTHAAELTAFSRRLTGNTWDGDDLVQATFARAAECNDSLHDRAACRAWLFQIARLHLDERRARAARPALHLVGDLDADVDWNPSDVASTAAAQVDAITLQRALEDLTPDHREALLLRDVWGFTYEEIAVIAELPIGTVRSRIARGRAALALAWERAGALPDAAGGRDA